MADNSKQASDLQLADASADANDYHAGGQN